MSEEPFNGGEPSPHHGEVQGADGLAEGGVARQDVWAAPRQLREHVCLCLCSFWFPEYEVGGRDTPACRVGAHVGAVLHEVVKHGPLAVEDRRVQRRHAGVPELNIHSAVEQLLYDV